MYIFIYFVKSPKKVLQIYISTIVIIHNIRSVSRRSWNHEIRKTGRKRNMYKGQSNINEKNIEIAHKTVDEHTKRKFERIFTSERYLKILGWRVGRPGW